MSAHRIPQLPDVNLLIALLWQNHTHHAAAQAWFATEGHRGWATNAITQSGTLRLLTNAAVTRGAVSPATALKVLTEATAHPAHHFWALDEPMASTLSGFTSELTGHRQWTDLVLLREAGRRGARLVTFDAGIQMLAGKASRSHLTVLGER